ncbi:PIN domain-containing protein [uncultured Brachyspira sp.]|uniref:PIN domain-containing protein n=1 Tax=uncultured Brachyspira sp. TaxID=221953 RepID=UPI00258B6D41|nr:PIN domain-containing protein [uncultured Brachyspira sp.]
MNFNKDYPIAILDTNIVIDYPYILDVLKCNMVIPQTIIDELDKPKLKDKLKKQNKYPKYFRNNLTKISDKTNLYKHGYKLENDCIFYLDADNLKHKEINFNNRKPDLQFIAVAKNLEDKYGNMKIFIISQDNNLKIYANKPDVKVKTLEEFITGHIKYDDKITILSSLYNINNKYLKNKEIYNSKKQLIFKIIQNITITEKDINKLLELAEKYNSKKIIFEILIENKDINGLYELIKNYNYKPNREKITEVLTEHCNILTDNKGINELYELAEKFNSKKIYERIFDIIIENKDINGLYELIKNHNYKPNREKITEVLTEHCNILTDNKDIKGLYELAEKFNSKKIYERIFEISVADKNVDELHKLYKKIYEMDEKGITGYKSLIKIIVSKIKVLESNNI